jgi:signal transduction histidine kinase/ActR/RegA family two-component response regulator
VVTGSHEYLQEAGAGQAGRYDIDVDEGQGRGLDAFDADDPAVRAALVDALVRADRIAALGRFAPGVQHELNNPLTAIVAFAQLIRKNPDLPDDLQRDAELLIDEAERTRHLVETLLNYVRPRAPERHPTKLRLLVDSVAALATYELMRHSVTLTIDIPDTIPAVPIDRSQIQQVVLGLVANAIDGIASAGAPGSITIQASEAETPGRVTLAIADDGPGIDPARADAVFEPFGSRGVDRVAAGLGLAVSRAIVDAHGGRLTHGSRSQGSGAVFKLELPLGAEAAVDPPRTPSDAVAANANAARVLVLDDEPAIRRFLEKALRISGREGVVATSGSQAIELAMDPTIGLVICDQRMADMTGTDVYRAIASRRPDLGRRFVLMTGDVDSVQLRAFVAEHGTRLLPKPFTLEDLALVLREADSASV